MHSFNRLFFYAKPFRKDILIATLYSIINKLFDVLPEVLIGVAVDIVVKRENSLLAKIGIEGLMKQLTVLSLITLFAFLMESVFQYLYQVKWRNLAQALQHHLRLDTYRHVQTLESSYFETQSTGNLLSIINDDINQLERFLDGGANSLIQVVTSSIVITIIFFVISPVVGFFALLPMPLILFGAFRFQTLLGPRYALVRKRAGLISERLSNNLLGITTIKSFNAEEYETNRLQEDSVRYQQANEHAITLSSAFIPLIRMAIVAGFIMTILVGGYFCINHKLEVASFSILVFLTQRLLWPFTRLAEMTDLYQRAMASADRVLNLLDLKTIDNDSQPSLMVTNGEILFHNLFFHYPNKTTVLNGFNLRIKSGETVAIVGTTGAGKSTLIKLLLRFYEPTSGEIFIDGQNIASAKLKSLRKAISLVNQDIFLFAGTIKENIMYGSFDASMDEVIHAAKMAEAHDFIMALPDNYHTQVGERGLKLSQGQKQRLCIARAIIKNAPIFVFDEATSSVDNETEEAIQKSLNHIMQGRTTIIIAHRLSTIRQADQIYVLDKGHIIEHGTHEELLGLKGTYANLWNIQTGAIATRSRQ